MDNQTKVILTEIEKINQEILILTQRVQKLEKSLRMEQTKIKPVKNLNNLNLDEIIKSANIAMDRFNKRANNES
jgi:NAD dependent epimerase/dehydratase family enzyme